jgi:hypothetical protein
MVQLCDFAVSQRVARTAQCSGRARARKSPHCRFLQIARIPRYLGRQGARFLPQVRSRSGDHRHASAAHHWRAPGGRNRLYLRRQHDLARQHLRGTGALGESLVENLLSYARCAPAV